MKPTELRIGNYVLNNCTTVNMAIQLDEDYFSEDVLKRNCAYLEPIQLTEQWLKVFGFKKEILNAEYIPIYRWRKWLYSTKNPVYLQFMFNMHRSKYFNKMAEICPRFSGSVYQFKCEYVHQLQNLYFALTGKELLNEK